MDQATSEESKGMSKKSK